MTDVKVTADDQTKKDLGITETVSKDNVDTIIEKANATGTMKATLSQEGVLDINRLLID